METLKWRKSSRSSGNGGDCVEIAELPDAIWIRDSKDPSGPVLRFSTPAFRAFIERTSSDRFDKR